jgi:predicted DNA-binding protein (MmcQ/YjbR family)
MNLEELIEYCSSKKNSIEYQPFGPDTLVYKVGGKMFALLSLNSEPARINLKCDPELAIELREEYPQIIPGYHMSKKHWNTIVCENLNKEFISAQIDNSYYLILSSLSKKAQQELE